MFFTTRKQVVTSVLVSVSKAGVAVIIAVVLCLIFANKINKISETLYTQKRLALLLQEKSNYQETLKKDYQRINDHMSKLENALPQDDTISEFLARINSATQEQGLKQTIKFNIPQLDPNSDPEFPINDLSYTLITDGNIFTTINVLKTLEVAPFANQLLALTLNAPAGGKGWEDNSSLTIQGQLFTRPSSSYESTN